MVPGVTVEEKGMRFIEAVKEGKEKFSFRSDRVTLSVTTLTCPPSLVLCPMKHSSSYMLS